MSCPNALGQLVPTIDHLLFQRVVRYCLLGMAVFLNNFWLSSLIAATFASNCKYC